MQFNVTIKYRADQFRKQCSSGGGQCKGYVPVIRSCTRSLLSQNVLVTNPA